MSYAGQEEATMPEQGEGFELDTEETQLPEKENNESPDEILKRKWELDRRIRDISGRAITLLVDAEHYKSCIAIYNRDSKHERPIDSFNNSELREKIRKKREFTKANNEENNKKLEKIRNAIQQEIEKSPELESIIHEEEQLYNKYLDAISE